jgi:hypothetical protein
VVAGLAASLNYHLGVVAKGRDVALASIIGKGKIEQWGLLGLPAESGGSFEGALEGYSWALERKKLDVPGLTRLELKVEWKEGDVSFVFYTSKS